MLLVMLLSEGAVINAHSHKKRLFVVYLTSFVCCGNRGLQLDGPLLAGRGLLPRVDGREHGVYWGSVSHLFPPL